MPATRILTDNDITMIRDYLAKGVTHQALARIFGVSTTVISKIRNNKGCYAKRGNSKGS